MLKPHCRIKASKNELACWQLANYTRPLFETDSVFAAEVILYPNYGKG